MSKFFTNLLNVLSFAEKEQSLGEVNEETIKTWLIDRLARQLKIEHSEIDTSRRFEAYGLDSLVAVKVAGDLEKLLEQRLSPALLFEHQTIDDLSNYLGSELAVAEAQSSGAKQ
jgi:acyl carrier protein